MMYLVGVLLAVVGVAFSIAWHELGHLIPAKKFGVKCTQYMVGFGPTIWSRRNGETEYGIKAIPLGGYVRMIGMFPPRPEDGGKLRATTTGRWEAMAEQARSDSFIEIEPGDEDRVFYKLPPWKRIIVMLGGPFMNLILAAALLTGIITIYGTPEVTPRVAEVSVCAPSDPTVTDCEGQPPAPANDAGLLPGDLIREVDGVPVDTWDQASYLIQNGLPSISLLVDRDGEQVTLNADLIEVERPLRAPDGEVILDEAGEPVLGPVGFLGATGSIEHIQQPIGDAPGYVLDALGQTSRIFLTLPERLWDVGVAAFGDGERDAEGPMSVVGVGRVAGEVTSTGLGGLADTGAERMILLLSLLASLNIALFIFNMVPLLPLDGGHIAGAVWESIKRGWAKLRRAPRPPPVDVAKGLPIAYTVAILLIGMTLLLVYADLVNPVRLGG